MGQAKWDRKMKLCRSELPGQDSHYTIEIIGLPVQDFQDNTPVQHWLFSFALFFLNAFALFFVFALARAKKALALNSDHL
jgi:hypothetical protein